MKFVAAAGIIALAFGLAAAQENVSQLAASKTGLASLFDPFGFSGAVLVITFVALIGTLILLVLSGGSFLTLTTASTGRRRRDASKMTEWTELAFKAIQAGINAWERS